MGAKRRGRSVKVADGLAAIVRTADVSGEAHLTARAAEAWEGIVGDEIARHTANLTLRDGELLVHVDSHAWAAELSALSETLRERINSVLGKAAVRSMRFTVSRKVEEERRAQCSEETARRGYGGDRLAPQPLSPEERSRVEASAAAIRSEELRDAAIRAAVRDLEWKKAQRARNMTQTRTGDVSDSKTGLLP